MRPYKYSGLIWLCMGGSRTARTENQKSLVLNIDFEHDFNKPISEPLT